jgi:hypothetical protein
METSEQSELGKKLSGMWNRKLLRCGYRGCICGLAINDAPEDKPRWASPSTGECVAKLEGKCSHTGRTRRFSPRMKKARKKSG